MLIAFTEGFVDTYGVGWLRVSRQLTIHALMQTPTLSPTIFRFDSVGSTNTEAINRAIAGAPEGVCIVAREQTAGRGRLERSWSSPRDAGLYFSSLLRPRIPLRTFPLITLMASLAVRDALAEACSLETDIKWPNDLMVHDRKLGGILAETIDTQIGRAVILGIGINLNIHSFPPELSATATSIESATGTEPDYESVLQSLTNAICVRYAVLQSPGGEQATVNEWRLASSYAEGKSVRVSNNDEVFEGITSGIEPDGALRVATADGKVIIVRAGDVTAVRPALL